MVPLTNFMPLTKMPGGLGRARRRICASVAYFGNIGWPGRAHLDRVQALPSAGSAQRVSTQTAVDNIRPGCDALLSVRAL
jgi:hypothetical protein